MWAVPKILNFENSTHKSFNSQVSILLVFESGVSEGNNSLCMWNWICNSDFISLEIRWQGNSGRMSGWLVSRTDQRVTESESCSYQHSTLMSCWHHHVLGWLLVRNKHYGVEQLGCPWFLRVEALPVRAVTMASWFKFAWRAWEEDLGANVDMIPRLFSPLYKIVVILIYNLHMSWWILLSIF